jgi:TolB-like protein/DNA-binding winged helix-turn-helix (wHTH) protein/Tfp pilus assembly protein PilF
MASDPQAAYEFGQFTLVPTEKRLLCDREVVPLAPKVFDTLVLLVENQGRLIQKDELLGALWPNSVVEEQALAHNVSQLRKVLRDPAEDPKFIETVPKRGYRFIAPVRALGEPAPLVPAPAMSGVVASAMRGLRWWRPTVLAVFAAVFVLVGGAAAYVYLSRTGQRAAGVFPAIHSLAVLPLENLSGDKEQEYFADGMTDALTTDLAQIGSLRVISRTSAMQFKGSKESLPQIGRDLKVDAIVEGTVSRGERRLRITAQLIEASSDHHLWARTYERDLKDVLALQDEIAQDIAEQIRVRLTPKERSLLMQVHAVDPEAHDAYLRGRYWLHTKTLEGLQKGVDYFQKAIAKDSAYARAYAGVADSFVFMGWAYHFPAKEAFPKAKEAALKALELDPSLAEAHASLAIVKFTYDWDWSGAEDEFKQAIGLNPNYRMAHQYYSYYLMAMGRFDEAVNEAERAHDLDPYTFDSNWSLGAALYFARRYDDALRVHMRSLEMFPDQRADLYDTIGGLYEARKMFAEAFAARLQALNIKNEPTASTLDQAYKRSGYSGYVRKKIQILEQAPQPEYELIHLYALDSDKAHAMTYLELGYNERFPWILFAQVNPDMDSIRSSPRFRDLVRRIGLPQSSSDKKN